MITSGWEPGQNYIWYFADGTRLVALFRTATEGELAEAVAQFHADVKKAIAGGLADKRTYVMAGVGPNPPPPGPGPGGEPPPEWLLQFVTKLAWEFDLNAVNVKLPKEMQTFEQQR